MSVGFSESQLAAMRDIGDAIVTMRERGSDFASDWAATLDDLSAHPEDGDEYFARMAREARDVVKRRANIIG